MKILWIKTDFLHPTNRGGQIRTLEMLRRLHARNEVHYVAFENPAHPEGLAQAHEYSTRAYPVRHQVPSKSSPAFAGQLVAGLFSPLPVAVSRYQSVEMTRLVTHLRRTERFDAVVCDFLAPAPNIEDLGGCVLFQHNVETMIWRRHVEHAPDPIRRAYLRMQAQRMFDYEAKVCRTCAGIIGVSQADADLMQDLFGPSRVDHVPTGVDVDYFRRQPADSPASDLVFLGSMDWMPNIDGINYFVREVLPLIRKKRPDCTLSIVGRKPTPAMVALADRDAAIRVTGTVPDVRPYLWGAKVSIVPLRIGGGTRLKIYESMAAGVPVVSTTVGAEGLAVADPENIRLADTPEHFADRCIELLHNEVESVRVSNAAYEMVEAKFSWEKVTLLFEDILKQCVHSSIG
jgi:polysaccharide biosynthesis protein PslH